MSAADPVLGIDDIVQRMNRLRSRSRHPSQEERWDRWKVRRLLEAGGVKFTQKGKRCKLYVTLSDLRMAFPKFWESLLDAEALSDDDGEGLAA